jgi:hypothetical protein
LKSQTTTTHAHNKSLRETIDGLRRGTLHVRSSEDRCAPDSIELFRRANRTLQETGANPLFLVVGMLQHRDADTGEMACAPLILLPLEIRRLSTTEGCEVRRSEADITLNAALVEWVVQYRIENPKEYLFDVRHPDLTLRDLSEAAMREIVGDRTVDEVLTVGRQDIENEAVQRRMAVQLADKVVLAL